jgi:hypothetical protein
MLGFNAGLEGLLHPRRIKVKIKVKRNRLECPFHTRNIKSKINFKNGAEGVRGSTFRKKRERWGTPSLLQGG